MKKIASLLLVATCLFALTSCGSNAAASTVNEPATTSPKPENCNTQWNGKSLKVLCIGNSFACNATRVLYQIAKAHGVEEIVLGVLHIPGCTVEKHWTYAKSGAATYQYYKNTTGTWNITDGFTMMQGLQDEDWDVITITQGQGLYGIASSYDNCLDGLIGFVNENKTNPNSQIAFHMTWALPSDSTSNRFNYYGKDQDVMFRSICDVAQNTILPKEGIDFILPSGTAIQNARTALGEIFCKDDGLHLNSTGEYVAGYAWFVSLTGQPVDQLKYLSDSVVAHMYSAHEPILEAVNASLYNTFDVTDISK